ncbi:MAG: Hsp33 family molecular chaperone HslO [Burkholderiales bacterium]|nr:MAG: Hsp33 family molecular chaperone HslO [Burkholderiales bacterium]
MDDTLLKFLFRDAPVRGEIVRLRDSWQQILANHRYPAPVTRLLGEMTAAAALLAANIKFDGALILQIQGNGPVRLLVVEVQPQMRLRATAKLRETAVIDARATLQQLANPDGDARCAITLDPTGRRPGQQPYQGVVPLAGETIAAVLENYLRQSEQLDSRLWLAADETVASGVLLQKLPQDGGSAARPDLDAWPRVSALTATLSEPELLTLAPEALAHRLYWEEQLEHFAPLAPRFECNCSRQRSGRMLVSLGREEVDSILAELGQVEITCDFCNARYRFDAVDIGQLFAAGSVREPAASTRH